MRTTKLQLLLPVLLVVVLLFIDVKASETRTFSMGQASGFIRDNSDVTLFPGTLNQYNSLVQTEMRFNAGDNAYSGKVHLPLPNTNFNIGVNINRPVLPVDPINLGFSGLGDDVYVNRVTDVLFGLDMNGNDVGFRVSYGADSYTADSTFGVPAIEKSASYIEFAGGLSNELFDVGASVTLPSVTNEIGRDKDEISGFGFNVTGRLFHKLNRKVEFVPLGIFGMMSATFDSGGVTGNINSDFGLMNLFVGGALNYQVNDQSLVVLGIHAYSMQSLTQENDLGKFTETATTFPAVFLGGETRLASWLIGRIGAIQIFQTVTETLEPDGGDKTETTSSASNVNFSFGLGMEISDFLIDVDINDSFFFEGPYFVSGHGRDFQDLFGKISVTYTFGNEKKEEK